MLTGTCPSCGGPRDWHGLCARCVVTAVAERTEVPLGPAPPRRLGDYELFEEVGRGGMGRVWRARQTGLDRPVALKTLRAGLTAGEAARARFRREALALARVNHPGIVVVHEVGEAEGEPFLAMEFVRGGTLAQRLARGPLPAREGATLVCLLADAVAAAHTAGVIHRDLKPSNVLLDAARGGAPRLVDFGVAQLGDEAGGLTATLEGIGSLAYLAPEQAQGRRDRVGPWTDVHGLGAVLYHAITGRPPFLGESGPQVLRAVVEHDPPAPRALVPFLPRDLETICRRCLEKDPARRYAGAAALRDDLRRFLGGEPIQARPASVAELGVRWVRRHPAPAGLLVLLVLAAFLSAGLWRKAEATSATLARLLAQSAASRAQQHLDRGETAEALALLARSLRQRPGDFFAAARISSLLRERPWARPVLALGPHPGHVLEVAWGPEGRQIATAGDDFGIRLWDAGSGVLQRRWQHPGEQSRQLAFSPDGRWLLSLLHSASLRIWPVNGAEAALALPPLDGIRIEARFHPRDQIVAVLRAGYAVELWAFPDMALRCRLPHPAAVRQFVFSPDGRWLATAGEDGLVRVWDPGQGTLAGEPLVLGEPVRGVHFHPDGQQLLGSGSAGALAVWDLPSRVVTHRLTHYSPEPACFTRRGWVLHYPEKGRPVLHARALGEDRARWTVTTQSADPSFAWPWVVSADGARLVTEQDGRALLPIETEGGRALCQPLRHRWVIEDAAFDPAATRLVVAAGTNSALVWQLPDPAAVSAEPVSLGGGILALGFTPDSTGLRWVRREGSLERVGLGAPDQGIPSSTLLARAALEHAVFSPDASQVALADGKPELHIVEAGSGELVAGPWALPARATALAFSPDRSRLAVGIEQGRLLLLEVAGGGPRPLPEPLDLRPASTNTTWGNDVMAVEFAPDSTRVAVGTRSGLAWVCDAASPRRLYRLEHAAPVPAARFSPDGRLLVTVCYDGFARLWVAATGRPTGPPMPHEEMVRDAAFSPDGRRLATTGEDFTVRVWDVRTGRRLATGRDAVGLYRVAFHPSGLALAAGTAGSPPSLWDTEAGLPLREPLRLPAAGTTPVFSPDGRWLALYRRTEGGSLLRVGIPSEAAPPWLPALAEAVAGHRLSPDGAIEIVPAAERMALEAHLRREGVSGEWGAWLADFLR